MHKRNAFQVTAKHSILTIFLLASTVVRSRNIIKKIFFRDKFNIVQLITKCYCTRITNILVIITTNISSKYSNNDTFHVTAECQNNPYLQVGNTAVRFLVVNQLDVIAEFLGLFGADQQISDGLVVDLQEACLSFVVPALQE